MIRLFYEPCRVVSEKTNIGGYRGTFLDFLVIVT
jgi:hypothetical protein